MPKNFFRRSTRIYDSMMEDIAMWRGCGYCPKDIEALIEGVPSMKGMDIEEKADVIKGLRSLRENIS